MNKPWCTFCRPGTGFIKYYVCHGTKLIGVRKLSRYTRFYYGQIRVSGCKNHYKSVLSAGAKAKSVTIQLPHIVRVMVRCV